MTSMLEPFLAELDPSVVWIVIALFVALLLITIIKKAIKFTIIVACLIAGLVLVIPVAEDFQSKYQFEITDGEAHITTEGQELIVGELSKIKSVKFTYSGLNGVDVNIKYTDTNMSFTVPSFLAESLQEYFDKYDIDYKIE